MGGAQAGLGFESSKKVAENKIEKIEFLNFKNDKKLIPSRNFKISPEEEQLHRNFIEKNFKTNFWYN
jgi:hypothetical protein